MKIARIIMLACSTLLLGLGVIEVYYRFRFTKPHPVALILPALMMTAGCCGYGAQSRRASILVRGITLVLNVLVILYTIGTVLMTLFLASERGLELPFAAIIWIPLIVAFSFGNIAANAMLWGARRDGYLY